MVRPLLKVAFISLRLVREVRIPILPFDYLTIH